MILHKFIYYLGQNYRNPSLKKHFKFLKESENWSLKKLEDYQLKKLKELVSFSSVNSNYYNEKFKEFNVLPSDILTLKDLKKLPITTKKELVNHNDAIHTQFYFKKKYRAVTSGSSGESLEFFREESADSFNRAAISRGYSWYDIEPWE